MRRTVVFVCGSLVLLFSACTASAEEQVNQPADSNVPAKAIKRAPVRTVEANAPPAALQRERFEQTRRPEQVRINYCFFRR